MKIYHYAFISSQKQAGKEGERDKIKFVVAFRSYPTRNSKFQKNSNKIKKIKIYHYGFISSQNRLVKAEKEKKYKLSVHFVPTRCVIENSNKMTKKFKKLENTIIASFQAKTIWKRPRRRQNKNYHSVPFLHNS